MLVIHIMVNELGKGIGVSLNSTKRYRWLDEVLFSTVV